MVGHQTLNLAIGVRVPASQPTSLILAVLVNKAFHRPQNYVKHYFTALAIYSLQ
jgi:hypothetical protein